ncbi:MAG: J domain-containing protein [Inquilinus sp.]|nr:J domain-containing protein [Inquilinus sp.]
MILVTVGAGWAIWRGLGTAIFDIALESAGRPKRSRLGPDWRERFGVWSTDRWSRIRRSSDWPGDADDEVPVAPRAASRGEAEAFRTLGLVEGASAQEIKRAHRRMMKRHHPDRGGSTEAATRLNRAREQLLQG